MSRPGGRRAAAPLIKDPQRYKARRRPPADARAASAHHHVCRPPHTRRRARQTELCSTYSRTGGCPYGHKCQFAHGVEDLRQRQVGVAPANP